MSSDEKKDKDAVPVVEEKDYAWKEEQEKN